MSSLASKVFAVSGDASGMGLATCRMSAAAKAKAISIGDFQDANFEAIRKELQSTNPSTEVQTVKVDIFLFCLRNRLDQQHHLELRHARRRCQCGRRDAACR